jgi:hypothetical protein
MALPFMAMAQAGLNLGKQGQQEAESSLRYDPYTGASYSPGREALGRVTQYGASPHEFWLDKDYTTGEKIFGTLAPGLGHFVSGLRSAKRKEDARAQALDRVKSILKQTPAYQSPEEVAMMQNITTAGADRMRGISDEMIRVAQAQQRSGLPGEEIQRNQIRQYAQSAVDDFIETGGASSSAMEAIVRTRENEAQNMLQLAEQANARDASTQQQYLSTLMGAAGIQSTATGMEAAGLQTGISEAAKQYQSKLEQTQPLQQFAITTYGNRAAQMR